MRMTHNIIHKVKLRCRVLTCTSLNNLMLLNMLIHDCETYKMYILFATHGTYDTRKDAARDEDYLVAREPSALAHPRLKCYSALQMDPLSSFLKGQGYMCNKTRVTMHKVGNID